MVYFPLHSITITAAKTKKLAKAGEGAKPAVLTVVVNAPAVELTATQTGASKITVTGADLTDAAADYVVKKGAVALSIKEVKLNEDKTEAYLYPSVTKISAGNYTLSFKEGEAVEFTAVDPVVAKIEITSEVAVLDATDAKKATATYKVYNQFDEDVTEHSSLAGSTKMTFNGGVSDYKGTVTFTSTADFTPNLSIVPLTIVCNANGVNAAATLTVSNKAVLDTVEFIGIYDDVKTADTYVPSTLKEKTTKEALEANYWAVFAGKDQYGNPKNDVDNLNVVISGIPGVLANTAVTSNAITINGVPYMAVGLTAAYNLRSGDCNVLGIVKSNGKTVNETVNVEVVSKLDTITFTTTEVYGATANTLAYEIVDTEGNLVTSYAVIKAFVDAYDGYIPAEFVLSRNTDGTAKFTYTPASTAIDTLKIFSVRSETDKFETVSMTVKIDPYAASIAGVTDTTILGALGGDDIELQAKNLIVLDQYGNPFTSGTVTVSAIVPDTLPEAFAGNTSVTGNAITLGVTSTDPVITVSTSAVKKGTMEIKLSIDGQEDSATTVKVVATDIYSVGNFDIKDQTYLMKAGSEYDVTVTATVGSTLVNLEHTRDFQVVDFSSADGKVSAPAINAEVEGKVEKNFTYHVVINNGLGTEVAEEAQYANTDSTVTYVSLDLGAEIAAASVTATELVDLLTVLDQYGDTADTTGVRMLVVGGATTVVDQNNTKDADVSGLTVNDVVINVLYTFTNGKTFQTDIPVVID